jgi:protein-disulfide isomerase
MAVGSKRPPQYDPRAARRARTLAVQIGLTAIVAVFAIALVLYIVMPGHKHPASGGAPGSQAVRVASSKLITKPGGSEPKAVLSLYEDFQCPHCRDFEQAYGPTITNLINSGAVAADYYMVAILNSSANQNYSTRAAAVAYCAGQADTSPTKQAFQRFHAALFAQQPPEGSPAPDNSELIETARQAGIASSDFSACVTSNQYTDMVNGLAAATRITATPTLRINGQDYTPSTPEALTETIKKVVGQ